MKYIDADRLRKEVKETEKAAHKFALSCADSERRKFYEGKDFAYQYVGILIDFLQKEMPEMDIEKEIEDYLEAHGPMSHAEYDRLAKCARHFYELGLNARKEE